ncbi:DNA cytosine methyltransferase [Sphingosinicella sp. BN140058]|uniref:DNA cytosine methyltransferase n=1 Tax=Sphingosinicella sp. BN140058 TaxID=1892855 RepID=UPI0010133486|nr:DNA cytosine methyltransferase [Sphingosinicella sp. BN140058]QAY80287.1 DNA cytosine methyltransferase [Sphingosinicella sp. BN140058]
MMSFSHAPLRSIELFGGAAGLGLGLAQAGFHHEIIVEQDHQACETIRHNQRAGHPLVQGWRVLEADVTSLDLSDVDPEPDLLAGGPPCQEFSIGGKHRGAAGERNLWPWTVQAVRLLRPRAFVFENVPALMTTHRAYFDYLRLALTLPDVASPHIADYEADASFLRKCLDQGIKSIPTYRVSTAKLVASDFGTAQKRSRVFLVGIRDDIDQTWLAPDASHSEEELMVEKWITGAYWRRHGLPHPEIDAAGTAFLRKHNRKPVGDLFAAPPSRLQPTRTVRDAIADLPTARADIETFADHLLAPRQAKAYKGHTGSPIDDPSKTLRAGVHGVSGGENMVDYGPHASPDRYRHFTIREAARLMDFPDDYRFPGTWSDGLKQLGNAVPSALGHAVGSSVARILH